MKARVADAIGALAALAQETRLEAFRLLVRAGPVGVPAGRIAEELKIPNATLSFHLSQLSHSGLVRSVREGRSIRYLADFAEMQRLLDFLTENCCAGSSCSAAGEVRVELKRRK